MAATRFHLGREQTSPGSTPVSIGPASAPLLQADEPPLAGAPEDWGIWIWMPATVSRARAVGTTAPEVLPEGIRKQLRSLGYLR